MKLTIKTLITSLLMAIATPVAVIAAEGVHVEASAAPQVKVVSGKVVIDISGDKPAHVAVYALTGQLVKQFEAEPGTSTIELPAGIYIVRVGHTSIKIAVK